MGFCSDGTVRKSVDDRVPIGTYSTRLPEILDCSFQWGCETPILGKGGAVGGRGWYSSKERYSFYRPSIVTFPVSLCISGILPLLFCSMPFFRYFTSSLPKISPCSPGSRPRPG